MLRYCLDGCIVTTGNCLRIVLVVRFRPVLQFGCGGPVFWLAVLVYSLWVEDLNRWGAISCDNLFLLVVVRVPVGGLLLSYIQIASHFFSVLSTVRFPSNASHVVGVVDGGQMSYAEIYQMCEHPYNFLLPLGGPELKLWACSQFWWNVYWVNPEDYSESGACPPPCLSLLYIQLYGAEVCLVVDNICTVLYLRWILARRSFVGMVWMTVNHTDFISSVIRAVWRLCHTLGQSLEGRCSVIRTSLGSLAAIAIACSVWYRRLQ